MRKEILIPLAVLAAAVSANAGIVISEVDPTGSSNSTYKQDWFELTNTGASAQDITGWSMDDNSDQFADAVQLRGVTSIPAGASVVFIEDGTDSTKDAALEATFETAWFGSNVPAGFTIGAYGGSSVGLSSSSDGVNIFDAAGNQVTGVAFGASTAGVSFDNSAGLGSTSSDPTISTLSVAGTNGAFVSPTSETGSPGTIVNAVPEPTTLALLSTTALLIARRRRSTR